jgi:hypothetical protein
MPGRGCTTEPRRALRRRHLAHESRECRESKISSFIRVIRAIRGPLLQDNQQRTSPTRQRGKSPRPCRSLAIRVRVVREAERGCTTEPQRTPRRRHLAYESHEYRESTIPSFIRAIRAIRGPRVSGCPTPHQPDAPAKNIATTAPLARASGQRFVKSWNGGNLGHGNPKRQRG